MKTEFITISQKSFRETVDYPELNVYNVRLANLDDNTQQVQDWHDLLNQDFEDWVFENKADPIVNEFYDELR